MVIPICADVNTLGVSSTFLNSITIVCAETTKTWDIAMIENQGKEKVVKELMDLLTKDDNWDAVWKVSGWQSGNESWEVKWERINFV